MEGVLGESIGTSTFSLSEPGATGGFPVETGLDQTRRGSPLEAGCRVRCRGQEPAREPGWTPVQSSREEAVVETAN